MRIREHSDAHRPWPAPRWPWALAMQWHDLIFMHWPVPAAALRPLIPSALTLDTFDGAAWIGVVPFRMAGVHPHFVPSLPWLSAFPELNVRSYVTVEGKPGIWFFSLDAANPLAVRAARLGVHLPYYDARMACTRRDGTVHYSSTRTHRGALPADLVTRYRPSGPVAMAPAGSLDAWLTERYCLYAVAVGGILWRLEILHPPWPLQPAEAEIERNTMVDPLGLTLPATPPLLHFARRQDVVAWLPELVNPAS